MSRWQIPETESDPEPEPLYWWVHWELLAAMVIGAGVVAGLAAAMLFGPGGPLEPGEWSWF